jgi:hypothetical protein
MSIGEGAYTLLPSASKALMVDVQAIGGGQVSLYGHLIRSNGNGTYFTLSLPHTRMTAAGTVDYERIAGLEGVALANVLTDPRGGRTDASGLPLVRTKLTHDDGMLFFVSVHFFLSRYVSYPPLTPLISCSARRHMVLPHPSNRG